MTKNVCVGVEREGGRDDVCVCVLCVVRVVRVVWEVCVSHGRVRAGALVRSKRRECNMRNDMYPIA